MYGTTRQFLEYFGLSDLTGLPTLKEMADLAPIEIVEPLMTEPLIAEPLIAEPIEAVFEPAITPGVASDFDLVVEPA